MIDAAVFVTEMEMLQQRFGYARDFTPEFLERYRDYLSAHMTTEEFTAAARIVFEEHDTWPSPKRFREALTGDPRAASEEAWNALLDAARAADGQAVTPEALATLKALGITFREIMYASEYQLTQIGKRFRAHHERAAAPDRLALEDSPAELEPLE